MERKEIYRRKQAFEQELEAYSGDDPLKLRYDFIIWLDGNFGRENVMDTYFPILEDTLKSFWNETKYQQDSRFVQLLITYVSMQNNPAEMYKSIHEKGTGSENPLFYSSWAQLYVDKQDYKKADEIFNLGLSKTKSKNELKNSYHQFLIALGKKFLHLINTDNIQSICPKCSNTTPANNNMKNFCTTPLHASDKGEILNWEMNPLKAGETDDFKCPVAVHDPPDPSKKSMYPKNLVYVGNKEYSLEEIRAKFHFERLRIKEELKLTKNTVLRKDEMSNNRENILKEQHLEEMENEKQESCDKELITKENVILPVQEETVQSHLTPQKSSGFPKPLLLHDSLHVSQTSYTAHMKEALNVVQEMWSSPSPAVSAPGRGRTLYKSTAEPPKESPFNNESCVPKRTSQFSIYTEEEESENLAPTPKGCAIKPGMPKAMTSVKKDSLQMREFNVKENNILSERKPKSTIEIQEFDKRPITLGVKQQLPFSNVPKVEVDNHNDLLAMKLGDVSIVKPSVQQKRMINIKPILPSEQDDLSDETCNTKAFNFSLPSSTPIQNKKFSGIRNSVDSHGGTEEPVQGKSVKTPGELSMILEASKERYSSNNSSNNGCALKGQTDILRPSLSLDNHIISQSVPRNVTPLLQHKSVRSKYYSYESKVEDQLISKEVNINANLDKSSRSVSIPLNSKNQSTTNINSKNHKVVQLSGKQNFSSKNKAMKNSRHQHINNKTNLQVDEILVCEGADELSSQVVTSNSVNEKMEAAISSLYNMSLGTSSPKNGKLTDKSKLNKNFLVGTENVNSLVFPDKEKEFSGKTKSQKKQTLNSVKKERRNTIDLKASGGDKGFTPGLCLRSRAKSVSDVKLNNVNGSTLQFTASEFLGDNYRIDSPKERTVNNETKLYNDKLLLGDTALLTKKNLLNNKYLAKTDKKPNQLSFDCLSSVNPDKLVNKKSSCTDEMLVSKISSQQTAGSVRKKKTLNNKSNKENINQLVDVNILSTLPDGNVAVGGYRKTKNKKQEVFIDEELKRNNNRRSERLQNRRKLALSVKQGNIK